jgi:hypothetical protein
VSAQPLTCDAHAGAHLADWLVTHLTDGQTVGYCDAAYFEQMLGAVNAVAEAEAAESAAEAERKLADVPAPVAEVEPAVTVKRGTSSQARAFRRRQAVTAAPGFARVPDPPPGPDDPTDDPTDEPAAPVPATA